MNYKNLILVAMLVFSGSVYARGGSMGSGGGMVVSCKDKPAELLDVYEAKIRYGKHSLIKEGDDLYQTYKMLMKSKFALQTPKFSSEALEAITNNNFYAFHKRLKNSTALDFSDDHGDVLALKSGCELKQVAIFDYDSDEILINQDLYNEMDNISKASLMMHELYYSFERKLGEMTSQTTRRHVGHLLSKKIQVPGYMGRNQAHFKCMSDNIDPTYSEADFELYITNDVDTSSYQFVSFDRRPVFIKTKAKSEQRFGRIYKDEEIDVVSDNRNFKKIKIKSSFSKDRLVFEYLQNNVLKEVELRCQKNL